MSLVSGFNGFGQLEYFYKSTNRFKDNKLDNITIIESDKLCSDIKFNWSYCVFKSVNEFYISGFIGNEDCCVRKLILPGQEKIMEVKCSRKYCLVLSDSGKCWKYTLSDNKWTNLTSYLFTEGGKDDEVILIQCEDTLNIVVTSSGWIYNIPSRIAFLPEIEVKDLVCGKEHSVLLSSLGQVFSWGMGSRGQLGHGDLETEKQPKIIQALENFKIKMIAAGGWHTWAVTEDDELFSWGWNCDGQLGVSIKECKVKAEPNLIKWRMETDDGVHQVKVKKVTCGSKHTVILLDNGLVYGCGWNNYGQLLFLNSSITDTITKLPTPAGVYYKDVVCGSWNSAFVLMSNT